MKPHDISASPADTAQEGPAKSIPSARADGLQRFLFVRDGRRPPGDIDADEDRAHADDLDRGQRFVEEQPREHSGGDRRGEQRDREKLVGRWARPQTIKPWPRP